MSIANLCDPLQSQELALGSAQVAAKEGERPVFHGKLGEQIKDARESRGWSIQRAVNVARSKKHAGLTVNRLRWLEEGRARFPYQEVLRAVADIYGMEYAELVKAFMIANYGRDVLPSETHAAEPTTPITDTDSQKDTSTGGDTIAEPSASEVQHARPVPPSPLAEISLAEFIKFYQEIRTSRRAEATRRKRHRSVPKSPRKRRKRGNAAS